MYGKVETLELLDRAGIAYELYEHEAVFTVAEAVAAGTPHRELGAKNLFLRDDKHRSYYLVCLRTRRTSGCERSRSAWARGGSRLASEKDLRSMLGLVPGAVTPLGALNDTERRVRS